eukprot:COSAG01_NODE_1142_length_11533_cov_9.907381_16_plen_85_part_00
MRLLESFDISAEKAELSKLAAQCKARDPDGQIDWPLFLAGVQGPVFIICLLVALRGFARLFAPQLRPSSGCFLPVMPAPVLSWR